MSWWGIGAAVIAAGSGAYSADQQRKSSNMAADAQKIATQQAARQADMQEQSLNKANGKTANADGFLADNLKQARKGVSGTILTSPGGAAPLGGVTTLLGGGS